ncbi:dihydrofolate reductase family protein [Sutcliffiella rhizosphaerae]|uniref:Bacterial bifunctional deaminase-reductase C-terminal domain-containing protein n=1 Tax=Sutcliffiella rhizosphaerae TaxID=2880967 RepID=A0ABM8YJQ1_9BACI|nr:dihydrofolate reductase family protein [Sutcliffiella rhizosphaerae]CAG9620159.1 putative protein YyaP [Sutcliffiella rhizosphaerae]
MRKVILSMVMSLDGFVSGKDGDCSWHVMDEEMHRYMAEFLYSVDTILYGRKAYEMMLQFWPQAEHDESLSKPIRDFARRMNEKDKIVFSQTLQSAQWNARVVSSNIKNEIFELKSMAGKDMVLFAGATVAQAFMKDGLIDEYRVIVNPLLLGEGQKLFYQHKQNLQLVEYRVFSCGNVLLVYQT